jgi:hypothetical protein
MSEADSSNTIDEQLPVDPAVETLPTDNGDSSQSIEIPEGKTNEESVENGNSSSGEEKQANETSHTIDLPAIAPPPPVVNPWNKSTKNARNSTEKGKARFIGFA